MAGINPALILNRLYTFEGVVRYQLKGLKRLEWHFEPRFRPYY